MSSTRDEKERKKKARSALLLFLNRLRSACKVMDSADTWRGHMQELDELLQHYSPEIPGVDLQRLRASMQLDEPTLAGVKKGCRVLQSDLQKVIDKLPAGGGAVGAVVGGLVVVAVVIAAAVIFIERTAVDVVIINNGCGPIELPGRIPVDIPGIHLPKAPIPSGGRATAKVPRLTVTVDATQGNSIVLSALGLSLPVEPGQRATQVQFDGKQILGQRTTLNLGSQQRHELVLTCR